MTYQLPKDRPGYTEPKAKKQQGNEESKMQQACVKWFDYQHSCIKHLLFAIPNGGARTKIEAGILKGEGVRKGVSDLFLSLPRGVYHGLYIEMKVLPNQPTDEQRAFLDAVYHEGYGTQVCYSKEQFISLITTYLAL